MTGVKTVRNVVICPAPCCYGYKQRTVFATKLARITFCEKIPEVKVNFLVSAVFKKIQQ